MCRGRKANKEDCFHLVFKVKPSVRNAFDGFFYVLC